jgi:hypothetical protein
VHFGKNTEQVYSKILSQKVNTNGCTMMISLRQLSASMQQEDSGRSAVVQAKRVKRRRLGKAKEIRQHV